MHEFSIDVRKGCAHDAATGCSECKVKIFSLCSVLTGAELDEIERMNTPKRFAFGETLASQDLPMASVFTVTDGVVRLHRLLPDGRRQILGFALPGDFLGLSLSGAYTFTAEAVTDVQVCSFRREPFLAFVTSHAHFLKRLHEFASYELTLAQDQMVVLGRRTAEERVAQFLMTLRARLARLGHTSATIPLPMNRQDIADYLGLTIETVSRTLTKLAKARTIVIVPDGVRLLNADSLGSLIAA